MLFIFCWLFISLWLRGCGSWQTSAQQQPSLSSLCLTCSLCLSISPPMPLYHFVFLLCLSLHSLNIVFTFCLSLSIPLSPLLITTVNRCISPMVWMLAPIFHDIYLCVLDLGFALVMVLKVESCCLFRTSELMLADGKCLHAY